MSVKTKIQTLTLTLESTHWLKILLFAATVIIGALYIWQVNVTATRGFAMRDLQEQIDSLTTENEQLDMEVARLQSVDSVTERVQMLGLTKLTDVTYVNATSSVAVNR